MQFKLSSDAVNKILNSDVTFRVLRDRKTNKALAVAFTEDGLKYTSNKTGKLIYFRNAKLVKVGNKLCVEGDIRRSNRVYTEVFKPKEFDNPHLTRCEILWIDKALKMSAKPN